MKLQWNRIKFESSPGLLKLSSLVINFFPHNSPCRTSCGIQRMTEFHKKPLVKWRKMLDHNSNIRSDMTQIYIFSIWNDGNGRVNTIAYSEGGYIWEKIDQLGKILRKERTLPPPPPFSHFSHVKQLMDNNGYFDYLQR